MLRFLATLAGISLVVWGLSSFVISGAPPVEDEDRPTSSIPVTTAPSGTRGLAFSPVAAAKAEAKDPDEEKKDWEEKGGKGEKKGKKKGRRG